MNPGNPHSEQTHTSESLSERINCLAKAARIMIEDARTARKDIVDICASVVMLTDAMESQNHHIQTLVGVNIAQQKRIAKLENIVLKSAHN